MLGENLFKKYMTKFLLPPQFKTIFFTFREQKKKFVIKIRKKSQIYKLEVVNSFVHTETFYKN